jgi:hypothetical protein
MGAVIFLRVGMKTLVVATTVRTTAVSAAGALGIRIATTSAQVLTVFLFFFVARAILALTQ